MNSMLRGTHVAHDDRDCVMRNMSAICICIVACKPTQCKHSLLRPGTRCGDVQGVVMYKVW